MMTIRIIVTMALTAALGLTFDGLTKPVPFASNGGLKMLYDNRMYPQAVALKDKVFLVWRGAEGFPYARSYDLASRRFSAPHMLLDGLDIQVERRRYRQNHHFAPVIWTGQSGRLHVLFGCHGTPGIHMVSKRPADITEWERAAEVAPSISYPKFHRAYGGQTLVYFRHQGHLGDWRYRLSKDGGQTWDTPSRTVVDLDAEPRDGKLASHAGSYNTTAISADGRTLHVAFIWKMEKPMPNARYGMTLYDHIRRHNLYYVKVDLPTGRAFNYVGKEVRLPVNKATADRQCLVWDTDERTAAVGPSIYLDQKDRPYLLLPVSDETPYEGSFYFVRPDGGEWKKTPITRTAHPFNASYLDRLADGRFRAVLITGGGRADSTRDNMDQYGWGDAVEVWISDPRGENWRRMRDLTPVNGDKYQNVQFVSRDLEGPLSNVLLFYGWKDGAENGSGYLWDNR
jgi:hypothetical protein